MSGFDFSLSAVNFHHFHAFCPGELMESGIRYVQINILRERSNCKICKMLLTL